MAFTHNDVTQALAIDPECTSTVVLTLDPQRGAPVRFARLTVGATRVRACVRRPQRCNQPQPRTLTAYMYTSF